MLVMLPRCHHGFSFSVQVATELLDDSLLTGGLLPAVRHAAAEGLITRDAVVVPAAATVWVQAAQICAPPPACTGGLDLRALDRYRYDITDITFPGQLQYRCSCRNDL